MSHYVSVFQPVTAENFFAEGYLMANPDVRQAYRGRLAGAVEHFQKFGHREQRKQVAREYLQLLATPEFRQQRFERFRNSLAEIPAGTNACPVRYDGNSSVELAQESSNPTAPEFFEELSENPGKQYADIGAGMRDFVFENCIYVEIYPSVTTDIVISPDSRLPFKDDSLDGIGCYAVLEHVREPWTMAKEFARVLKPGAKLFVDWPFLQPVHGYPSHYYNATPEGVRAMFERDFTISRLRTQPHEGPDYTIFWILSGVLRAIQDPKLRKQVEQMTVAQLTAEAPQSPFWLQLLATLHEDDIKTYSCGNQLIGVRKSE